MTTSQAALAGTHQGNMTFVQGAHGGYQADGLAGGLSRLTESDNLGNGM
jgi:hypothetical protein